jgi:predicted dehydrogenase
MRHSPIPTTHLLRRRHDADARRAAVRALDAGKHVYCEKPISDDLQVALDLARKARASGLKHGVVQDKLFLPGLRKLALLRDSGFFGKILSVRGEFGYWVFEGDWGVPAQRPSWNYRKADGGGIILDMLCHWRYVLDNLFGEVKAVSCLGATHIGTRVDEQGKPTIATPMMRPMPPSSSKAAPSPISTPPGRCASAAMISSPSRSTAPTARPLPA